MKASEWKFDKLVPTEEDLVAVERAREPFLAHIGDGAHLRSFYTAALLGFDSGFFRGIAWERARSAPPPPPERWF